MSELRLYKVDPVYLRYLHKVEAKVSVKFNNRPFVGVITTIQGVEYLIPLTSQTTSERAKTGKKKRAASVTTFVRDSSGVEIANLLHNNMIPVKPGLYTELKIVSTAATDTYEMNEVRFIRKNQEKIEAKARKVHDGRIAGTDWFLNLVCCDFALLEQQCSSYTSKT